MWCCQFATCAGHCLRFALLLLCALLLLLLCALLLLLLLRFARRALGR
jgi:hypothetical protein